jgi:hypothetical protein
MSYPRGNLEGYSHRLRNPVKISGRFTADAAPVVTPTDVHGFGFTPTLAVALTPGRYLITFADAAARISNVRCITMCAGAAVDLIAIAGTFTPGGPGAATLLIHTMTGNVETDILVGDYVCFECTLYGETLD